MPDRAAPICRVVCFNERKILQLKRRVPNADALGEQVARYKAMGHPGRLAVLSILATAECCVCDLANVLEFPVSTVSQHLRTLKNAGLLQSRQDGKLVFYSLASTAIGDAPVPVAGRAAISAK